MAAVPEPPKCMGAAIPANTPHAVSVMFPTWQDNVGYEEGDPKVTSQMECGYPRFFIHPCITKLSERLRDKLGKPTESCLLLPSQKVADRCRDFMKRYYAPAQEQAGAIRIAELEIAPMNLGQQFERVRVFIVLFPKDAFSVAKQFWQHSGDIFSSRAAEYCLRIMDEKEKVPIDKLQSGTGRRGHRHRYGAAGGHGSPVTERSSTMDQEEIAEHSTYLEERYGRNLPLAFADQAKCALRRRIAGVVSEADRAEANETSPPAESGPSIEVQRQTIGARGFQGLSEDEVYLFPCGMGAIYHAHRAALATGDDSLRSVCFGFPYTDTLKILQKWGKGCQFYGLGNDDQMDELEQLLTSGERILSVFCELPSNPLLKSPDLKRLSRLSVEYGFILVVDETIGNFCNVAVLEWADIVVSSLTKLFSGDSNVMGGSMILNPNRQHYQKLKAFLNEDYEDLVWSEDAVFLERNSRSFKSRSAAINANAEAVCDYLMENALGEHPKVWKVCYPKYTCREHYDAVKTSHGGYGGLFSLILQNEQQATQFYDALKCAKGPSLGTNFTLASPYTILAHYTELDWAKQFDVPRHLIRVSVGLEDRADLLSMFKQALDAVDS